MIRMFHAEKFIKLSMTLAVTSILMQLQNICVIAEQFSPWINIWVSVRNGPREQQKNFKFFAPIY